jgi:hypothetical protein
VLELSFGQLGENELARLVRTTHHTSPATQPQIQPLYVDDGLAIGIIGHDDELQRLCDILYDAAESIG